MKIASRARGLVLALFSLFVYGLLGPDSARAQVYVDESSNYGDLTRYAGSSPFNYVDEFQLRQISGSSLGSTTLTVTGQNGRGACSGRGCLPPTYRTTFDPPVLKLAQASTDGSPWTDLAPATDLSAQPVKFTCISSVQSPCSAWSYSGQLPYGSYALHLTGTSCGGYLCRLAGASYIFVQSNLQWIAVAP